MEAPNPADANGEASTNGVASPPPTDPAPTRHDIPVAHPDLSANGAADALSAPIFEALVAERGTSPV